MSLDPQLVSFDELSLGFGQLFSLFPDPANKSEEYQCMIIGCLPGESLIIGPPSTGVMPRLVEGQKVYLRVKLAAGVALFSSVVLFVSDVPTIMVYLDFPQEVKFKEVRGALRVKVNLPVLISNLTNPQYSIVTGKFLDISTGGAGVETAEVLGQSGDNIEIKGKLQVANIQRMVAIPARIRSVSKRDGAFTYGVEFNASDEDSLLVLFGYIFMKWRLSKSSVFADILLIWLVGLVGFVSSSALAFDESRLWLAKSHYKFYLPLIKAAAAAEAIDRCVEVLEGTLDIDQSTPEAPIFRILCRQENGRSYNEMVDGTTFDTLTTPKVVPVELTPEELERIRLDDEERQRQLLVQRKQRLWRLCEQAILERSNMMIDFAWTNTSSPEPLLIDDDGAEYETFFDAKNMWGQALHYQALCKVSNGAVIRVEISKNRTYEP